MSQVHSSAAQGFAAAADTYTRGRPGYPPELMPWLAKDLGLVCGTTCVDLGAGTGKFTRLLTRTGATVTAVEPVAEMRAQFAAALPDVPALAGTAQAIPLPDGGADAVVCAQAFHWFGCAEAVREIHRVLRPGGRLGLVWNVRDEAVDWVAALTGILAPYEGDTPRFRTGQWRDAFGEGLFTGLEEACFPDRTLSVSFIAALPGAERAKVEARLRELIAGHPDLRGRETVAFPYLTRAYRCCRR
jgi:SAM-dependent methyltransferase